MSERGRELARLFARLAVGVGALVALLTLVNGTFRPELESFGHWVVDRLGYPGIFLGALLADSVSFPVPAQAYMVAVVKGGADPRLGFAAIAAGTVVGACIGRVLGRQLPRIPWVARRLEATHTVFTRITDRWGALAVVIVTLMPLPFSPQVYAAGAYGLSPRLFALLVALRVPKLLVIFLVIRAALS